MPKSAMWKKYILRFAGRILVLVIALLIYFLYPDCFSVLNGMEFFHRLSPLHLLWAIWMADMFLQLIPARKYIALGSQKQFACYCQPAQKADPAVLRAFVNSSDRAAAKVFVIWLVLTLILGVLYKLGIFGASIMVLISVFFYLCDLICVLFWCPFRVFLMKNRCCTTCRIFNWDHLMMFSILAFVPSFFTLTLFFGSVLVFAVWEILFHRHPERFWDRTNRALRCVSCTDKLCACTACIRKPSFK